MIRYGIENEEEAIQRQFRAICRAWKAERVQGRNVGNRPKIQLLPIARKLFGLTPEAATAMRNRAFNERYDGLTSDDMLKLQRKAA